ncbi:hypothetical protein [uncultured Rhodospira sp.]|uniref:hypothetical protein n=1 Tax=uncultured Rhodospira sp. TaxID=1936189 RepID=UPI0026383F63|nr:hypothetical protein [uncultured Rhodospira sp.]
MDQTASQALRNLLIVPDNRLDDVGDGTPATITGGAWLAERPLSHLLDRRFILTAVSDGLDEAATQFRIDYGGLTDLRVCVLIGSMSKLARVRRVISTDPAGTEIVHDGGWTDWCPVIGGAFTLPRADPSYGHGRISDRELRQYPRWIWHDVAPEAKLGRYEHIYISDPTNPAGSVTLMRAWTGSGWQTSVPVEYAAEWGWEDLTDLRTLLSGRTDADIGPTRRTMTVRIDGLPEAEAMRQVYDAIGRRGISGQMYVTWDPTETMHRHRRSGIARMASLPSSELARHDWITTTFKFLEEVA